MNQVRLQVQPPRSRCENAMAPPPFEFSGRPSCEALAKTQSSAHPLLRVPLNVFLFFCRTSGVLIDAAFFLVLLTVWCALHLVLWSYSFDMGPAAACFDLPCPGWVEHRVMAACGVLAIATFIAAQVLRKLQHNATSNMLLLLVTFDVAALILLGISIITG